MKMGEVRSTVAQPPDPPDKAIRYSGRLSESPLEPLYTNIEVAVAKYFNYGMIQGTLAECQAKISQLQQKW
jgi:hypothetical protein